jgi:two-component system NtrC family sensor kinase
MPMVMGSQDQLQGVWINLLTNAVDALEERDGEIRISSRLVGREIRVVITDTGTGIPPEKMPRIFEPFFTTKAPGRGTGLGLSVCHRVIKQHGGDILVASQVGVGTQFTIILPVQ